MTAINGPSPETDDQTHMHVEAALKQRIGKQIRDIRKARNLSMQHLAEKVGVSSHQIYKYEHGSDHISASLLFHVSTALGVPINVFYYGTAEANTMKFGHDEPDDLECPDVRTIFETFETIRSPEVRAWIGRLILALKG